MHTTVLHSYYLMRSHISDTLCQTEISAHFPLAFKVVLPEIVLEAITFPLSNSYLQSTENQK